MGKQCHLLMLVLQLVLWNTGITLITLRLRNERNLSFETHVRSFNFSFSEVIFVVPVYCRRKNWSEAAKTVTKIATSMRVLQKVMYGCNSAFSGNPQRGILSLCEIVELA